MSAVGTDVGSERPVGEGCSWFESEGLGRRERGLPMNEEHLAGCAECRAASDAYEQLGAAIAASLPEPGDRGRAWRTEVWAALDAREQSRAGLRWLWLGAPVLVAVGMLVMLWLGGNNRSVLVATLEVTASDPDGEYDSVINRLRTMGAFKNHDIVEVLATISGASYAELRLYHEDSLLLACSDQPPCERIGNKLSMTRAVDATGQYELLLVVANDRFPPAGGNIDADTAAARARGAQIRRAEFSVY